MSASSNNNNNISNDQRNVAPFNQFSLKESQTNDKGFESAGFGGHRKTSQQSSTMQGSSQKELQEMQVNRFAPGGTLPPSQNRQPYGNRPTTAHPNKMQQLDQNTSNLIEKMEQMQE